MSLLSVKTALASARRKAVMWNVFGSCFPRSTGKRKPNFGVGASL
jgi:hypothetical protein